MKISKLSQVLALAEAMRFDPRALPQGVELVDAVGDLPLTLETAWVAGFMPEGETRPVDCLFTETNARACAQIAKGNGIKTTAEPLLPILIRVFAEFSRPAALKAAGINDHRVWLVGNKVGGFGCPSMMPLLRGSHSAGAIAQLQKQLGDYLKGLDKALEVAAAEWTRFDRGAILATVEQFRARFLRKVGRLPCLPGWLIRSEWRDEGLKYLAVAHADRDAAMKMVIRSDKNARIIELVEGWSFLRCCSRTDQIMVQRGRVAERTHLEQSVGTPVLTALEAAFNRAKAKVVNVAPVTAIIAAAEPTAPVAVEHIDAKAERKTRRSVAAAKDRQHADSDDADDVPAKKGRKPSRKHADSAAA